MGEDVSCLWMVQGRFGSKVRYLLTSSDFLSHTSQKKIGLTASIKVPISHFLILWEFQNKGLSFPSSVGLLVLMNSQKFLFIWKFPTSTLIFLHCSLVNSFWKGDGSRLCSATDPFDYNTSIFFAWERRNYRKSKEWFWFCFLPLVKMIFLHNCQVDFHQNKIRQLVNSTRIFELNLIYIWTTVCDRWFIFLDSSSQFSKHANLNSSTEVSVERILLELHYGDKRSSFFPCFGILIVWKCQRCSWYCWTSIFNFNVVGKVWLDLIHQRSSQHQFAFKDAFSRKICEFVSCLWRMQVRNGSKVRYMLTSSDFLSHTFQKNSAWLLQSRCPLATS